MFFKFIDFSTIIDQSFDRIEEPRFDAVVAAKLNRGRKRDGLSFRDGQKEEGTGTIGA